MISLMTMLLFHSSFNSLNVVGYVDGKKQVIELDSIISHSDEFLRKDASEQLSLLIGDAAREGVLIRINSSFRNNKEQYKLYKHSRRMCSRGIRKYCGLAAKPGYSTHQQGLSVDISGCSPKVFSKKEIRKLDEETRRTILSCPKRRNKFFCDTDTFKWLSLNAHRYGFSNDIKHEPWHWTFTDGKDERAVSAK